MDQNYITIVCISDTHCKFVELPPGEILIHCGDFSIYGKNIDSFIEWLVKQEFKHKIVIGGNHERPLDIRSKEFDQELKEKLKACCHYLENSSVVLEGYKFWGSPYTLASPLNAFHLNKNEATTLWKQIEHDAQFILTHEPPYSYGDKLNFFFFSHVGDKALLEAIRKIQPKYHIFGHVHEGYGIYEGKNKEQGIKFINCSINDHKNQVIHVPIIIKVPIIQ